MKYSFMPNVSQPGHVCVFLELQNVDCGVKTACLERLHFSLDCSNYCGFPLVGGLGSALHDKVSQQKAAEHGKISASSHKAILTV